MSRIPGFIRKFRDLVGDRRSPSAYQDYFESLHLSDWGELLADILIRREEGLSLEVLVPSFETSAGRQLARFLRQSSPKVSRLAASALASLTQEALEQWGDLDSKDEFILGAISISQGLEEAAPVAVLEKITFQRGIDTALRLKAAMALADVAPERLLLERISDSDQELLMPAVLASLVGERVLLLESLVKVDIPAPDPLDLYDFSLQQVIGDYFRLCGTKRTGELLRSLKPTSFLWSAFERVLGETGELEELISFLHHVTDYGSELSWLQHLMEKTLAAKDLLWEGVDDSTLFNSLGAGHGPLRLSEISRLNLVEGH